MSEFNYQTLVDPFIRMHYVNDEQRGYVVWRFSPGDVVEIVHLEAYDRRKGHGTSLVCEVLSKLPVTTQSVYGFTRNDNYIAQEFYAAFGFRLVSIPGLYQERVGFCFCASYRELYTKHGIRNV